MNDRFSNVSDAQLRNRFNGNRNRLRALNEQMMVLESEIRALRQANWEIVSEQDERARQAVIEASLRVVDIDTDGAAVYEEGGERWNSGAHFLTKEAN